MNIPYAIMNFGELRRGGYFYADKTRFIPLLEDPGRGRRYVLFLRPRRFGKSLFLSTLEHYYDVGRKAEFDELFTGLHVGDHPTLERNRYLILKLEFSGLSTDRGVEPLRADFSQQLRSSLRLFFATYRALLPEQAALWERMQDETSEPAALLTTFLGLVQTAPYKLYLLIDEYDNFTNDLIARGDHEAYRSVLSASGFVRQFYQKIKAGTDGPIARLFMTGVSPVMVNDMTSGFNILNSIFLDDAFRDLCGLGQAEVETLLDGIIAARGLRLSRERALDDLRRYYDGYCFSLEGGDRLYNPAMVLYFMARLEPPDRYPNSFLDMNVRIDHSRLHTLLFTREGQPRQKPQEQVRALLADGSMLAHVHDLFRLEQAYDEKFFASYLYYLGLLTIEGREGGGLRLRIPNAVIHEIYGETLGYVLETAAGVKVDEDQLLAAASAMAWEGRMEPLLQLLHEKVITRLSNRDLIGMDERTLKALLLAYLSLTDVFLPFSELELGRGYSDLVLVLNRRHRDARFSFLLELKYIKESAPARSARGKKGTARVAKPGAALRKEVAARLGEAEEQLRRYLGDPRLEGVQGPGGWKAFSVVQVGTRALYYRELGQEGVQQIGTGKG